MPSIAIMNAKGGVGKSTLTMAFAETLAVYHRKRCLLIDADGQMSLSLMMAEGQTLANNQGDGRSLVALLSRAVLDGQSVDWQEFIISDISDVDDAEDLHLIQGDMDLPLLEREISRRGRIHNLRSIVRWLLDEFEQQFDFVFIDCAPGISVITETWLRECDYQIIPVKPDFLAFTALEYLRQYRGRDPQKGFACHLGAVISMQDLFSADDREMEKLLRENQELWCFQTSIPNIGHIQKAALFSKQKRSYVGKYPADAGKAIRNVTHEIMQRLEIIGARMDQSDL